jgi:catechol 2,3-dioxygenase-like lactoylglutathione lyase family enzyme
MVSGLWHFSFTVSNLERSIDFYCGLLGMRLRLRQDQDNEYTRKLVAYPDASLKVAQLSMPGTEIGPSGHVLELVQFLTPSLPAHPPGTGYPNSAHMAFTVEDLHAEHKRLREAGVTFRSDPIAITAGANRGGATVYFLDPDGVTLELLQPPPVAR